MKTIGLIGPDDAGLPVFDTKQIHARRAAAPALDDAAW